MTLAWISRGRVQLGGVFNLILISLTLIQRDIFFPPAQHSLTSDWYQWSYFTQIEKEVFDKFSRRRFLLFYYCSYCWCTTPASSALKMRQWTLHSQRCWWCFIHLRCNGTAAEFPHEQTLKLDRWETWTSESTDCRSVTVVRVQVQTNGKPTSFFNFYKRRNESILWQ